MPFNWFKRQLEDNQNKASVEQDTKSTPDGKEDSSSAVEPTPARTDESASAVADTAPANAQDYLAWAKTAYQNIQQQQEDNKEAGETEGVEDTEGAEETEVKENTKVTTTDDVTEAVDCAPEISDEPEPPTTVAKITEDTTTKPAVTESAIEIEIDTDIAATDIAAEPITMETVADDDVSTEGTTEQVIKIVTPDAVVVTDEVTRSDGDREQEAVIDTEPEQITDAIASEKPEETTPTLDSPDSVSASASVATPSLKTQSTSATPFWAKAETERLERLERLKETAIEEEPDPAPQTPQAGVEFDEDFVWSAGVLASQGRRPDEVSVQEIAWLTKLRQSLGKTRRGLINQLKSVVGQGPLNEEAVMEIESLLLQADVGIDATDYVIEALQEKMKEGALPPEEAIAYLKEILRGILDKPFESEYKSDFVPEKGCLNIWMLTGVNGAGKTTTIGKLAHMTRSSDYRCLIAAADTFRAAAVEQVKVWGDRSGVEVIANPGKNTDPAAVVFDAISAAQSRNVEVLLVDTAGRLQNKKNLMAELGKIRRIVDKKAANANVESLLVLDATLGQNGLRQAQVFSEAAKLSGVVLTKLDGSAKGGVALAVVQQLGLPIRFVGAGEGIEDLRPFSSYEFVEALLSG